MLYVDTDRRSIHVQTENFDEAQALHQLWCRAAITYCRVTGSSEEDIAVDNQLLVAVRR